MSVSEVLKPSWLSGMARYFRPRAATMLLLGFSSGLPFFLTANTLGYWLRDDGISLTTIGFLSWVGLAYSLKPLFAPVIDRVDAPLLGWLGRRRGWMLTAQFFICSGLLAMALFGPQNLAWLGVCALVVAFASSTQDVVVDAWRIEIADNADELSLLTSAYQLGYRAAILIADGLILIPAAHLGWPVAYGLMAALMSLGFWATWRATEPVRADAVLNAKEAVLPLWTLRGFADAVAGPFVVFFRSHGRMALLMLAIISLYRFPEFVTGPLYNPFYHDLGLSKDLVGSIRVSLGLAFTLLGITASGLYAARFGAMKALMTGALLQGIAVGSFALLSYTGNEPGPFAAVMAMDSFGNSFAGVALIAYMSSLTSLGYTATQYAILTAAYAYLGKILKGPSGAVVEHLSYNGHTLLQSYALFFVGAGAIALLTMVLCAVLSRLQKPATAS